eukprot:CAMPEP_0197247214 /NCGR_PEP_ID=MMETSP1429-20130617/26721_1 /TAXON_ID=49237 /ORGANISM="Chaetoceros  sp., Strain UNC1202" /LENGTH=243 /DNA_ID=CAMNT_0042708067 /DNA_START=30 /DNA_END=761 /DNA_ORIENTATION=+
MKTSAAALLISLSTVSAFNAGYLGDLSSNTAVVGGAGLGSYLDNMPSANVAISGSGIGSYLDSVSGSAPAVAAPAPPAPAAAAPAPVAAAPVVAASAPAGDAPAVGEYLGSLAGSSAVSGGGLMGYLDALPSASTQTSGSGLGSYLDILAGSSALSGSGIPSFADCLKTSSALSTSGPAIPSITSPASGSFLENIYDMIMQLDASDVAASGGQLKQAGDAVAFTAGGASGSDAFAMSFVKKGN